MRKGFFKTKTALYKRLARTVEAYQNCVRMGNEEWEVKHLEVIDSFIKEYMPSGSGFDGQTILDVNKSTGERLVFVSEYHYMDDNGMYAGWIYFSVIVTPSLAHDYNLSIVGPFSKHRQWSLKEYIYEVFDDALQTEVED